MRRLTTLFPSEFLGVVEREGKLQIPVLVWALAVRLHSTGISLRETAAVREQFGSSRSHQAVFQWVHRVAEQAPDPPRACPRRVAVDETAVTIGTEQQWLYAAINIETKLVLGVRISERQGTDPAAAFLGQLAEKHDLSETTFLVDGIGYLTALARCDLGGHLDYVDRNLIEKWFQTLVMRIDRFHQTWMGRRASAGSPPSSTTTTRNVRIKRWMTAHLPMK